MHTDISAQDDIFYTKAQKKKKKSFYSESGMSCGVVKLNLESSEESSSEEESSSSFYSSLGSSEESGSETS